MIKIPQQVITELHNLCQKNHGVKVNLYRETDNFYMGGLEFTEMGLAKVKEKQIKLEGYLQRLLTFSRVAVRILINDIPLNEVEVKYLTEMKYLTKDEN